MTDTGDQNHNNIPYYHTNIDENRRKIFQVLTTMLEDFVELTETVMEDGNPVVVREVLWETPELAASYNASQLIHPFTEQYGYYLMLEVTEYYGDEFDQHVHVFIPEDDNKVSVQTTVTALTAAHQAEHDEWFAKHSKPTSDGEFRFAIMPDTTDDIAYKNELILQVVENGYALLTTKRNEHTSE